VGRGVIYDSIVNQIGHYSSSPVMCPFKSSSAIS
jgi:hypothetical protein